MCSNNQVMGPSCTQPIPVLVFLLLDVVPCFHKLCLSFFHPHYISKPATSLQHSILPSPLLLMELLSDGHIPNSVSSHTVEHYMLVGTFQCNWLFSQLNVVFINCFDIHIVIGIQVTFLFIN